MQIKIKTSPQLEDLVLIARLVDRLADLAVSPESDNLRRDIKARLRRLVEIRALDSSA